MLRVVHHMAVQISFIATNLHSVQRYKWRSLIYLDALLEFHKLASIETKHTTVSHHKLVNGLGGHQMYIIQYRVICYHNWCSSTPETQIDLIHRPWNLVSDLKPKSQKILMSWVNTTEPDKHYCIPKGNLLGY